MKTLIFLFIWISIEAIGQKAMTGEVVSVIDGNTLEIKSMDAETIKVVLADIDSPETGQEYADKAKNLLEKLVLNKEVQVTITGKDRWGKYIAVVMRGSHDPRIDILESGLAWTAEKNPQPDFEAIRLKAQEKGKGLWKSENPTPPWIYRRQQSMMQAKSY